MATNALAEACGQCVFREYNECPYALPGEIMICERRKCPPGTRCFTCDDEGCEYCGSDQYFECDRDGWCHHGCEFLPEDHADRKSPCEHYEEPE